MSAIGYLQVYAFTSSAQIPLQDATVTITDPSGSVIAMRLTDRSGKLENPVVIPVPDKSAGMTPNTGIIPFTTVNLYARHENYEEIFVRGVQVFPGTVTEQQLKMIPLAEFPGQWNKGEEFNTPPQNL